MKIRRQKAVSDCSKKELFDKRSTYYSARAAISKNAKKVYRESKKKYKCIICGYEKSVDICHVKAISKFDEDALIRDINDISNLIALCPNHHNEYDNCNLDISSYLEELSPGKQTVK